MKFFLIGTAANDASALVIPLFLAYDQAMRYLAAITLLILGTLPAIANAQCQSTYTTPSEKVEPTPVVFKADNTNLRAGPGLKFCLVRALDQGKHKPATIIAKAGT